MFMILNYILLTLAIFIIIFEIISPGLGILSVVSLFLFSLFFFNEPFGGIYIYILNILGIIFLFSEIFFPSYGILFFTGFFFIFLGLLIGIPLNYIQTKIGLFIFIFFILFFISLAFYLSIRKIATLKNKKTPFFNYEGKEGIVVKYLSHGKVMCKIEGVYWKCLCDEDIKIGEKIIIIKKITPLLLKVNKKKD